MTQALLRARDGLRRRWPQGPLGEAIRIVGSLFWDSAVQFQRDQVGRLAAALSFYALLSVAPLLVVTVTILGSVFGQTAARAEVVVMLDQLFGSTLASDVDRMLGALGPDSVTATLVGVLVLTFAASNIFAQLKSALNTVWGVDGQLGFRETVRGRGVAFLLVLATGALLVVSVIMTTLVDVLVHRVAAMVGTSFALPRGSDVTSFLVFLVLIALMYKLLPDTKTSWRDVLVGAAFTAALMLLGTDLIGRYLSGRALQSVYGAAAGLLYALLWVYYSILVFMYGAVFTHTFAVRVGSRRPGRKGRAAGPAEGG